MRKGATTATATKGAAVAGAKAASAESAAAALAQLQHLSTERLLGLHVDYAAKKSPRVSGFYNKPPLERGAAGSLPRAPAPPAPRGGAPISRARAAASLKISGAPKPPSTAGGGGGGMASIVPPDDAAPAVPEAPARSVAFVAPPPPPEAERAPATDGSPDARALFAAVGSSGAAPSSRTGPLAPRRLAWTTDGPSLLQFTSAPAVASAGAGSEWPPRPPGGHGPTPVPVVALRPPGSAAGRRRAATLARGGDGNSPALAAGAAASALRGVPGLRAAAATVAAAPRRRAGSTSGLRVFTVTSSSSSLGSAPGRAPAPAPRGVISAGVRRAGRTPLALAAAAGEAAGAGAVGGDDAAASERGTISMRGATSVVERRALIWPTPGDALAAAAAALAALAAARRSAPTALTGTRSGGLFR